MAEKLKDLGEHPEKCPLVVAGSGLAAKGVWSLSAGVLSGQPIPEHSLTVGYTAADYYADLARLRDEVLDKAKALMDPRAANWVRVEWIWF